VGLKSIFMLGSQLVLHFLRALWPFGRHRGAGRFLENYRGDFIRPLEPRESEQVTQFDRCTNCGLCEAVCPLDYTASDEPGLSPNRLAVSEWRDLTAHRLIQSSARVLADCRACAKCEAVCPARIPILNLAELVAHPAT